MDTDAPAPTLRDWLDFLNTCQEVVERGERGDVATVSALRPRMFEAARRIQTQAGRVVACALVTQLAQQMTGTPGPTPMDPRARDVLNFIQERHSRPECRLQTLARALRVSRPFLSRLIARETGRPFKQHVQLARMSTAARLLQETSLSIKEVSARTGYAHVPSFVRQFKNHFKLPPGELRRATTK